MSITILKYPDNIEEDAFLTRRIVFMAVPGELNNEDKTWYRGQKGVELKNSKDVDRLDVRCMITLPIPGSLSDNQTHDWSTESVLGGSIKLMTDTLGKGTEFLGNMVGFDINGAVKDTAEDIGVLNSLVTHFLGARKRVPNPGEFQTYNKSSLREFTFAFDFIPETKNEAKNIIDIISAFKSYSSPSCDDAFSHILMLSPFLWIITLTNGVVNKLLNLKLCACTNVSVTYGTDKFDIFEDGMPKKITMSLSFKESELTYAENYNKGLETQSNDANSVLNIENGFVNSIDSKNENVMSISGGGFVDKMSTTNLTNILKDKLSDNINEFKSFMGQNDE